MLDDWSGVDVERAVGYIRRCMVCQCRLLSNFPNLIRRYFAFFFQSHEGGYGQQPTGEALGKLVTYALLYISFEWLAQAEQPIVPWPLSIFSLRPFLQYL